MKITIENQVDVDGRILCKALNYYKEHLEAEIDRMEKVIKFEYSMDNEDRDTDHLEYVEAMDKIYDTRREYVDLGELIAKLNVIKGNIYLDL